MSDLFKIKILTQNWLMECRPEEDLCSHGKISLLIDGKEIAEDCGDYDYCISLSALAMLRSLDSNHTEKHPVAEKMIYHCGPLYMSGGCPVGINWSVKHLPDKIVKINKVVLYPEANIEYAIQYSGIDIVVPFEYYRNEICAFAINAKKLFDNIEKQFYNDLEEKFYREFWEEYNNLLGKHCNRM
jgi:hypothetical protein